MSCTCSDSNQATEISQMFAEGPSWHLVISKGWNHLHLSYLKTYLYFFFKVISPTWFLLPIYSYHWKWLNIQVTDLQGHISLQTCNCGPWKICLGTFPPDDYVYHVSLVHFKTCGERLLHKYFDTNCNPLPLDSSTPTFKLIVEIGILLKAK